MSLKRRIEDLEKIIKPRHRNVEHGPREPLDPIYHEVVAEALINNMMWGNEGKKLVLTEEEQKKAYDFTLEKIKTGVWFGAQDESWTKGGEYTA